MNKSRTLSTLSHRLLEQDGDNTYEDSFDENDDDHQTDHHHHKHPSPKHHHKHLNSSRRSSRSPSPLSPRHSKNKYGVFTKRDDISPHPTDRYEKKRDHHNKLDYESPRRHHLRDDDRDYIHHRKSPPLSSHRDEFDRTRIRNDDLKLDIKSRPTSHFKITNVNKDHDYRSMSPKNSHRDYNNNNNNNKYSKEKLSRSHSSSLSASMTSLSSASLRSNSLDKLSARRHDRNEIIRPTTAAAPSTMLKRTSFGPAPSRHGILDVDERKSERRRRDDFDINENERDLRRNKFEHFDVNHRSREEPVEVRGSAASSRNVSRSPRLGYMKRIEEDSYLNENRKPVSSFKMEPTTTTTTSSTGYNQPRYKPNNMYNERLRLDL